jgi:GT2 family glycosyltransferase
MPFISLLVGILNPPELTENFLCWLAGDLKDDDVELVIVCDGDSNVRTHRLLRDAEATSRNIRVIFQDRSVGYGAANNLAAYEAKGEVLVFLNSDTFPTKGAVRALANFVKSDERVGVAQGLLIYPHNLRVQSTGHIFGPYFNHHALAGRSTSAPVVGRAADRQALTSAFYAVRRTDFISNNGFDEFYLNAFEAMEFALKMHLKGYRCVYHPRPCRLSGSSVPTACEWRQEPVRRA